MQDSTEILSSEPTALEIDPALDPKLDHLSRRALLERAGAGALAAAVAPMGLQEAKVRALDDPEIIKSDITFVSKGADGKPMEIKAFLALPKNAKKTGSVIVVHEIFGLTDHIKDVACRCAQAGFIGLAPDLFTREGTPPPLTGGFGPLMQFVGKISDKQIAEDVKAAMKTLAKRKESNKKAGIVGFCWGGRVSMIADGYIPELNAAVAYYGRITGQKSDTQPAHPLDLAEKMKAPLLGHFGGKDQGISVADVDKLREALHQQGKTAELYVYDAAGHAFNNDTRPSYHAESAKLAWQRTLDWFKKHLG
jgi:carboxymethylenebutenolidase